MHAVEDWSEDEVVTVADMHFEADGDGMLRVSLHAIDPQRMIRFRVPKNEELPLLLELKAAMNAALPAKEGDR